MTRKKDIVKLNKLHLIKRRRMQKFHARTMQELWRESRINTMSSNVCVN